MSYSPWSSSEANEIIWTRGRNGKPKREWGNLLLDMFAKATECSVSELPAPSISKDPVLWGTRGWEPRGSFLLVLHVLKYLLDLFMTSWTWKTLGFAGQKTPSGFCVCGALACMELSKHETWAGSWSLRAPGEVSPVSSAMQMDVIHFAHFPPKRREKGWTEWGVALCPSEGSSKGLLAEVENVLKREQAPPSISCGPPAWERGRSGKLLGSVKNLQALNHRELTLQRHAR